MFILAMAIVISYLKPRFVYEELSKGAMATKSIAVVLVFAGTYLITISS
jgi:hypothetical protein